MATLDGNSIFGIAVNIVHCPHPNAQQFNEFFGVNGLQTLFGGAHGRTFMISGVLVADNITDINTAEALLLSYADGLPHTLVDNRGRVWLNVIFRGEYQPFEQGPRWLAGGGCCLPYKLTMMGVT